MRTKRSGTVVLSLCALLILNLAVYARQQSAGENKSQIDRPSRTETSATARRPQPRLGTREEKLVRDVYARLMRFHTAARDEQAATSGVSYKPEDYVVFELRDIHTGPIDEVAARPLTELVTNPTGEVLKVTAHHLQYGNGPRHSLYDVSWSGAQSTASYNDTLNIAEMLTSRGDKLSDVNRYTSFEVTIRLSGKERSYRGIALHHSGSGKPRAEILDNTDDRECRWS